MVWILFLTLTKNISSFSADLCDLCGERGLALDFGFVSPKKKVFSAALCDLCGEDVLGLGLDFVIDSHKKRRFSLWFPGISTVNNQSGALHFAFKSNKITHKA